MNSFQLILKYKKTNQIHITQKTKKVFSSAIFFVISIFLFTSFSFKKLPSHPNIIEEGYASYYCDNFVGRKTASGEIFTSHLYTCAHKTLPFGTLIKVTNIENGEAIIVKVNDRGPFVKGRVIDLSLQGAKELGLLQSGIGEVQLELVNQKYSSVGNVRNMEKIVIEESYAYVPLNQPSLIEWLYSLTFNQVDANG